MTEWFHALDGHQNGPVSEDELRSLVEAGRLGPEDLVWSAGMPEWLPLGTLPRFSRAAPSAPPPTPPLATHSVAPRQVPSTSLGGLSGFEVRGGGDIDLGEAIRVGWNAFGQHFGVGCLGVLIYVGLSFVAGCVPVVGLLAQPLVGFPAWGGVLFMGVLAADHALGHGRVPLLDDVFAGFTLDYAQSLIYSFLFWLATIALVAGWFFIIFTTFMVATEGGGHAPNAVLLALTGSIPFFYFGLRWVFVWRFMLDQRLGAIAAFGASWRATRGQLFPLLVLGLLAFLIYLLGFLMLLVGLIPATFLGACIYGAAYRQVAGDQASHVP